MGGSTRWDADAWSSYSATTRTMDTAKVYKTTAADVAARGIDKTLNPHGITIREARDSTVNPCSTPVAVFLDVSGSMGMIADNIAKEGLGVLFKEVLDRKPVTDPQVMFGAIGDAFYDRAPFQVSQFEGNNVIIDQLTKIFLEGGGGSNSSESYHLAWYMAAKHIAHDSIEKRSKKGYLFTIGDEMVPPPLTRAQVKQIFGDDIQADLSAKELLEMAERTFNCFHLMVEQGSHMRHGGSEVKKAWGELMGQRAIPLSDYKKLSEVIVSVMQVMEGEDKDKVTASWSGSTAVVVKHATKDLVPGAKGSGVIRL